MERLDKTMTTRFIDLPRFGIFFFFCIVFGREKLSDWRKKRRAIIRIPISINEELVLVKVKLIFKFFCTSLMIGVYFFNLKKKRKKKRDKEKKDWIDRSDE